MKDEQFHKDFIRTNFTLLTSPQFDRFAYKAAYRKFYIDKHTRIHRPSAKELIDLVITHLRASMNADEVIELLDTLPFFRETGERERELLKLRLSSGEIQSALTQSQLDNVKKAGAFQAVKTHHLEEVRKQSEQEVAAIEAQIQQKRHELESLPSVLDEAEIEEPEFDPDIEGRKSWWERFYLQGDPFPQKDGLSAISTDRYEEVIIKTDPFQRILSLLKTDPSALFSSGSLLVGDFGYGKTTFVDYLSHFLIHRDILPLRVTIAKGYSDASGFADAFLNKLRAVLADEVHKIFHKLPEKSLALEVEDQVVELAKLLTSRRSGIIVFMDDFHKFHSHYEQIFEFLGTLQVLKDNLTRQGAKVGFVVSGIPLWLEQLKINSQLHGFLDATPIQLPSVSAELVCEVFNRRIAAYCFESTPRRIKPDFVRRLVRDLGGEQGIRGCLTKIIEELSNNNLAIVDSPVEISETTLEEIGRTLEGSSEVKASLNKLRYESRFRRYSNEQIAKCFEILVHIFVQNGIAENDRQFKEGSFYFQVLRDAGLIQKQKGKIARSFKWNLSSSFANIVALIRKRYKLTPADYLLKLYAYKEYASDKIESVSGSSERVSNVKELLAQTELRMDRAAREAANEGLTRLDRLLLRQQSVTPTDSDVKIAGEAFESLTTALSILDGSEPIFSRLGISDPEERWELKPGTPEIVYEACRRFEDYRKEKSVQTKSHVLKTAVDALIELSQQIAGIIEQLLVKDDPLLHRPSQHTVEEITLFNQVREGFFSGLRETHFDYMRAIIDYLELRFRSYLFFAGNLVFGDSYFDHCPEATRSYALKNTSSRSSFASVQNAFDGLTRSQYRPLLTESNPLRDHCLLSLALPWDASAWALFAGSYAAENIKVAHLQVAAFAPQEKQEYRVFARYVEELTAAICELVRNVFDRNVYLVEDVNSGDKEVCVLVVFKGVSGGAFVGADGGSILQGRTLKCWPEKPPFKSPVFRRRVPLAECERITRSIRAKIETAPFNVVTQDLLDIEYIQTHYRATIADFVSALAWACHNAGELDVQPWFGSSIAIKQVRKP